jgi:heme exporter protein A
MWEVAGNKLGQSFNNRIIFNDITFQVKSGGSLVITGPNGSGKTTLLRIICHLIQPKLGKVTFFHKNKIIRDDRIYSHLGLVSPYLQLYNNLTALENFNFFSRIRSIQPDISVFKEMMENLGLRGREMDEVKTYSSGMMQRLKYVMALIHNPEILILDEPTANLDEEGIANVYEIMEKQKKSKILILATNEHEEIRFGEIQLRLTS